MALDSLRQLHSPPQIRRRQFPSTRCCGTLPKERAERFHTSTPKSPKSPAIGPAPGSTRAQAPGFLPACQGTAGVGPIAATIPMPPPMPWRCSIRTSPRRWRPTCRAAPAIRGKTWSRSRWWASSWRPADTCRSGAASGPLPAATPTARCTTSCGIGAF